jgi:DNA-binding transcriptional LysR family regulator
VARLCIAQPSLSAQIKYLERTTGAPLFTRHPRGVELTRAGALFLAEARKAIQAADAAIAAARTASRGEAGTLRVGFIVGTQVEPTSRVLSAFRQRHPHAELEFAEYTFSDPSAGLNGGHVDIAFIMPPITRNGLRIEEIYHVPRVAVISTGHRLASRATISVRELFDDPWIVARTCYPRRASWSLVLSSSLSS